ncbi:dipeptide ABC transporter ATP-binding protein [Hoyosella subflava]|uniref:Putative peptide ABC transporter ATP-binding protein n=1 Tax=Hoyosella subflava (strain DSM 45089 / JCM 17490 / NBRC 109087 / DQS3-9A1) TaxID=443218 RepID=F6EQT7_HOYSD|nr:ABC transporter ATP-binding protein [Hoyosella subflava]AEF39548.1 Putative peptide ABC transporter ATP-binding protein [Hoyosella subflava DQS3-9A1]
MTSVLEVRDLTVRTGPQTLINNIAFTLCEGRTLALVGASGSGKSLTALAVMGLLGHELRASGSVRLGGKEILGLGDRELSRLRGRRLTLVSQDPLASLTPVHTVGAQVAEAVRIHQRVSRADAWKRAVAMLTRVGIEDAEQRARSYPHEFSGGMRQRVAIAMAMINEPDLLIADEPTSALDPTIAAQIMELFGALQRETGTAILFITHDVSLVERYCDELVLLEGGSVVEHGTVREVIAAPRSAELRAMVAATPHWEPVDRPAVTGPVALSVAGMTRTFRARRLRERKVTALEDVTFTVHAGEAFAIVGESGAGKSTLLREILHAGTAPPGVLSIFGEDPSTFSRAERQNLRREVQIVLQDPGDSLDPLMSIASIVAEPLHIHRVPGVDARVRRLLRIVGLTADFAERRSRQLSGGQRQRVAIARALALEPRILLLDEPVSALDMALRSEIMALLDSLRQSLGLTYVMVSHDMPLVHQYSDRVAVMWQGRIVEQGPAGEVLGAPQHPYTQRLVAAVGLAPSPI